MEDKTRGFELFENDSITKPSSGQKMSKAPILWPDKDLGAKSEAICILKQIEAKQKLALSQIGTTSGLSIPGQIARKPASVAAAKTFPSRQRAAQVLWRNAVNCCESSRYRCKEQS